MHKSFDTSNIQHGKQADVQNERAELADYVKRQMEERNWSTYDVVRESGGLIISNSTVWNVLNQRVKDIKEKTLQGLAKAFKVTEEEVFNAYRGKSSEAMSPHDFLSALEAMGVEQFSAYGGVEVLTLEDQQEIIALVETMVEQKIKRRRKKTDTTKPAKRAYEGIEKELGPPMPAADIDRPLNERPVYKAAANVPKSLKGKKSRKSGSPQK